MDPEFVCTRIAESYQLYRRRCAHRPYCQAQFWGIFPCRLSGRLRQSMVDVLEPGWTLWMRICTLIQSFQDRISNSMHLISATFSIPFMFLWNQDTCPKILRFPTNRLLHGPSNKALISERVHVLDWLMTKDYTEFGDNGQVLIRPCVRFSGGVCRRT